MRDATDDETIRSLIPYMQTERHGAGDILFQKGDPADRLYIIQDRRVRFTEIVKVMSDGEVFGEVGVFSPRNARTRSARCDSDCRLHTITHQKVLELYYQTPQCGVFLMRLAGGIVNNQGTPDA